MTLADMIARQNNKCHYCSCEMNHIAKSPQLATVEHLVDKWSSPKHIRNDDPSNLVAACFECNNSRGNVRNRIARDYYKTQAAKKSMKLAIASTSSRQLYSLFGSIPQHIFA
jgi:5-methylcytosine-specific restriction endonuclease McrA